MLRCSFCGKSDDDVERLIAGPRRVFICDECVVASNAIIADSKRSADEGRFVQAGATISEEGEGAVAVVILRIQHSVPNFDRWKDAFDSDPMDRKAAGVRRYQIHRPVGDPNYVIVDLEFDSVAEASRLLERLRELWTGPGGAVMRNPEARIIESVESRSV